MVYASIMGLRPEFYIGGRERRRVHYFWVIIFLVMVFGIFQSIILGSDIVKRKDPKVTNQKTFSRQPKIRYLGENGFNFKFSMSDAFSGKQIRNNSYLQVEVFQGHVHNFGEYKTTPLKVVDCPHEVDKKNNYSCVEQEDSAASKNISFGGRVESGGDYYDIGLTVNKCQNSSKSSIVCAPIEDINKLLDENSIILTIDYLNQEFNPYSFEDPTLANPKYWYQPLGSIFATENYFWLDENIVSTDSGALGTNIQNHTYSSVGKIERATSQIRNGVLLYVFLQASGDINIYMRSYIKIPDIIAQVEAVLSIALICGFFMIYPYNKIKYYEDLINNLYDYDSESKVFTMRRDRPTILLNKSNKIAELFSQSQDGNKPSIFKQKYSQQHQQIKIDSQQSMKRENSDEIIAFPESYCLEQGSKIKDSTNKCDQEKVSSDDSPSMDLSINSEQSIHKSVPNRISFQKQKYAFNDILAGDLSPDKLKHHDLDLKNNPTPLSDTYCQNSIDYESSQQWNKKQEENKFGEEISPISINKSVNTNQENKIENSLENFQSAQKQDDMISPSIKIEIEKDHIDSPAYSSSKRSSFCNRRNRFKGRYQDYKPILKINFCEMLLFMFQCFKRRSKLDLLLRGRKQIKKDFDIIQLMKTIQEVDKMKLLLSSTIQNKLEGNRVIIKPIDIFKQNKINSSQQVTENLSPDKLSTIDNYKQRRFSMGKI